jgi:hypothetical protein
MLQFMMMDMSLVTRMKKLKCVYGYCKRDLKSQLARLRTSSECRFSVKVTGRSL